MKLCAFSVANAQMVACLRLLTPLLPLDVWGGSSGRIRCREDGQADWSQSLTELADGDAEGDADVERFFLAEHGDLDVLVG